MAIDTINVVKKASKDLKIQRSLSRKRAATTRSLSSGGFSIINHSVDKQSDFNYERNSVTKKVKVQPMKSTIES